MALGIGIREGIRTVTRNSSLFFLSLLVAGISFFLLSIFSLVTINLYALVKMLDEKIEIIAFLEEHADLDALQANISKINGVQHLTYVSAEKALQDLQKELKESQELLRVFEENPLPASLRIKLHPQFRNSEGLAEISGKIMLFKGVKETIYGGELVEELKRITDLVAAFNMGLLLIIILSVIFVIFQTIKLAIFAQAPEIEIMRLVGASDSFIVIPFAFQGMVQGFLGGLIAFILTLIAVQIANSFFKIPHFPKLWFLLGNLGVGMIFGIIGSSLAIRKFLK